ncbi:MAG TPA: EAL domain-containing protein [Acetobacteraceae bacterium]|nr:EAL domain-containing protein [Acetobacteraceae bacterium]
MRLDQPTDLAIAENGISLVSPAVLVPAGSAGIDTRQAVEILDKSLNAILVHRDGRLLYANQAFARLNGYGTPAEALARHTIGRNVHPADRALIRERIAARLRGEESSSRYEFRLLRPGGEVIWVECLASQIMWNGTPALMGAYHDVTGRKRAEEALRRSERLFATIFRNSPDIIMLNTLADGKLIDVNEAFLRTFGGTRASVIGRTTIEMQFWSGSPAGRESLVAALRRNGRVRDMLHSMRVPSGETIDLSVSAELLRVEGEELILSVLRDITERRRAEARIAHMARHDSLTGLANRALFHSRLEEAFSSQLRFGVLSLNLDRFKEINESFGHAAGDALLKQIAARLDACVRGEDTVARFGGDEFAIIQISRRQPVGARALARRVTQRLSRPFELEGGRRIAIAASIVIAVAPRDGADPAAVLGAAELALRRAKRAAPGTWQEFEPGLEREAQARRRLDAELRRAIAGEEFELFFQPLVDLRARRFAGCEALLRWRHPTRGLVSPSTFVHAAEESGLIGPLGAWVLRHACAEAARWPEHLKVAVNISPAQLRFHGFMEEVRAALDLSGLSPKRLELEVTESVVIDDTEETVTALRQLKSMGVSLALDDFGTGYSSLGSLVRFPFDRVKIDRSFVAGLGTRADCAAIVRAVAGLCATLRLAATAEGIETAEQLAMLTNEGVPEGQGYLFSTPRPGRDIAEMLRGGPDWPGMAS